MHPHNYYLEILTETGIIGFLIISLIFCKYCIYHFIKIYFENSFGANNTVVPFIFLFIAEIFPLKRQAVFLQQEIPLTYF